MESADLEVLISRCSFEDLESADIAYPAVQISWISSTVLRIL